MSDPENFITRWSRRKRAAAERVDEKTSDEKTPTEKKLDERKLSATSEETAERVAAAAPSNAPPPELPFDLAKLPSLESITAESDIRAFLAPSVPAELTRAALRRAWSADPKIRDFVGLADYDWDFNTPGAIGGFGPLEMTDEVRRQVAQMVGRGLAPEAPEPPTPTPDKLSNERASVEASDISTESSPTTCAAPVQQAPSNVGTSQDEAVRPDVELHNFVQRDAGATAPQYQIEQPDNVQLIAKRPHGRALPK
jgi:Protein of unknown function (DUF3306)